nr:triose-phosphate isomerase family protein [Leifsonia aquatica]
MNGPITVGVSLKAYFGYSRAVEWCSAVARSAGKHPAVRSGDVSLFVAPTFVQIPAALTAFAGTRVQIAAQDVSSEEAGAATGEVTASELAELGVRFAEIGHAERRARYGEDDEVVAAKVAAALRHNLTPILCLGESSQISTGAAATEVCLQLQQSLRGAPLGPVVVAYEPVWAIGASLPAEPDHISEVAAALRRCLNADPARAGSAVLYGGSAGPGLLGRLGDSVNGLFLGRFAHDPTALIQVVDEALRQTQANA